MTASPKRGQWISLGMLLGGHADEDQHPLPSYYTPPPIPEEPEDDEEAWEIMEAGGYTPEVQYPGNRSSSWTSRCKDCGQIRRPTVSEVEAGIRCKHRGRQA
ncbi:hypothetical protein [Streptomyces sp. NPDC088915]|uniref:hypothetical protein n=1 Tax=Streptomyces sp. NPDC088915 TaxID=3365912 RepID=UPI003812FA09